MVWKEGDEENEWKRKGNKGMKKIYEWRKLDDNEGMTNGSGREKINESEDKLSDKGIRKSYMLLK